jgi:hypothetical protein
MSTTPLLAGAPLDLSFHFQYRFSREKKPNLPPKAKVPQNSLNRAERGSAGKRPVLGDRRRRTVPPPEWPNFGDKASPVAISQYGEYFSIVRNFRAARKLSFKARKGDRSC